MYCSTCGIAIADSLTYCNHCGARTPASNSDKVATSRDASPGLLVSAMVATFIFGLPVIAVLLGVMKTALGLELGQILGFAVLSFLILILLEGVFLTLLLRRNRGAEEKERTESLPRHTTKELAAPREPLSSVTDHTTRAFDPILTNRNKTT